MASERPDIDRVKAQRDAYILRVDDLLSLLDAARALRTGPPTPRKFQALDEAIVRADAVSVMAERPDIDRLADTVRTGIRPFDYDDTPWNNGDVQDALDELVALARDKEEYAEIARGEREAAQAVEARVAELEREAADWERRYDIAGAESDRLSERVAELEAALRRIRDRAKERPAFIPIWEEAVRVLAGDGGGA